MKTLKSSTAADIYMKIQIYLQQHKKNILPTHQSYQNNLILSTKEKYIQILLIILSISVTNIFFFFLNLGLKCHLCSNLGLTTIKNQILFLRKLSLKKIDKSMNLSRSTNQYKNNSAIFIIIFMSTMLVHQIITIPFRTLENHALISIGLAEFVIFFAYAWLHNS